VEFWTRKGDRFLNACHCSTAQAGEAAAPMTIRASVQESANDPKND